MESGWVGVTHTGDLWSLGPGPGPAAGGSPPG